MNRIKAHIPILDQMAKVLQSWFPCLYKSSDWFYVFCYEITFGSYHQYTSSQECANGFIQHDASTALYNSNVCFFFFSKWEKIYISLVRNKLTNLHSPLFKKVNKITLFKMWSSYKTYNYTDTYQYSTFNLPKKNMNDYKASMDAAISRDVQWLEQSRLHYRQAVC